MLDPIRPEDSRLSIHRSYGDEITNRDPGISGFTGCIAGTNCFRSLLRRSELQLLRRWGGSGRGRRWRRRDCGGRNCRWRGVRNDDGHANCSPNRDGTGTVHGVSYGCRDCLRPEDDQCDELCSRDEVSYGELHGAPPRLGREGANDQLHGLRAALRELSEDHQVHGHEAGVRDQDALLHGLRAALRELSEDHQVHGHEAGLDDAYQDDSLHGSSTRVGNEAAYDQIHGLRATLRELSEDHQVHGHEARHGNAHAHGNDLRS